MKHTKNLIVTALCILLCFSLQLCGCSVVKSMDRTEIMYNGRTYSLVSPYWKVVTDNYEIKTVSSDGESLNIRAFADTDRFIYCEDDSLLYYDDSKTLPNVTEDVDYLTIEDIDGDGSSAQKYEADEFLSIVSSTAFTNVRGNNKATIILYYKDFPACYFYGNIVVDAENNYWLYSNDTDDYRKISEDSAILSSVS